MYKQLKSKTDGFTIIEVLIVLAIAGLIMIIVFLAVPALQRNNRNTQRDSDAQRIASAVNECVANNNGQTSNCDQFVVGPPAGELQNYINPANNQQLRTYTAAGPVSDAVLDDFDIDFSQTCDAAGTGFVTGQPPRAFTVTYRVETSGGNTLQCIGG